jgi:hypothetical protein
MTLIDVVYHSRSIQISGAELGSNLELGYILLDESLSSLSNFCWRFLKIPLCNLKVQRFLGVGEMERDNISQVLLTQLVIPCASRQIRTHFVHSIRPLKTAILTLLLVSRPMYCSYSYKLGVIVIPFANKTHRKNIVHRIRLLKTDILNFNMADKHISICYHN